MIISAIDVSGARQTSAALMRVDYQTSDMSQQEVLNGKMQLSPSSSDITIIRVLL